FDAILFFRYSPLNMRFPHFIVPLFVGFSLSAPVDATAIFAHGVSKDQGWYDSNKTGIDDTGLCWAAAASNVLQWWQDQGTYIPNGTPNGTVKGKPHQTVIFDSFKENWKNVGNGAENGFRWYLGGNPLNPNLVDNALKNKDSGKYWEQYINSIGYNTSTWYQDFPAVTMGYSFDPNFDFAATFVPTMINLFNSGAGITLGLAPTFPAAGHEITLWGLTYDENNILTSLYYTDSDDGDGLKTYHFTKQEYNPGSDPGEKIVLTDYIFGNAYINDYNALTLPFAIPEPSSVLLSLLGGSLLCLSRRRR
ncbi:MAG: PEP-CTERM sorting domain-containing protein, partial [Akkermansia sp.]